MRLSLQEKPLVSFVANDKINLSSKIQNFEKLGHYGLDSFIISKNLSDDEGGDINRCDFFKRIIL